MTKFEVVTDEALIKARLFNKCRLDESGCWSWTGPKRNGYGVFYTGSDDRSAHRISYEVFKGSIEKGLILRHTCDNPSCINPDHLIPGTMKDNAMDRQSRGRGRDAYGENSGTAKLSAIESLFTKISDVPIKELSDVLGVSEGYLYRVRNGQSWEHLNIAALWARLNASAGVEGVSCGN